METVAVAVKSAKGMGSQRAVRWAVERILEEHQTLLLIHVIPFTESILKGGMYADRLAKWEKDLQTFKDRYSTKKIEGLLLKEDRDQDAQLLEYISESGAGRLILGSFSISIFREPVFPEESNMPAAILKRAPQSCRVYVVSPFEITSNSSNPLALCPFGKVKSMETAWYKRYVGLFYSDQNPVDVSIDMTIIGFEEAKRAGVGSILYTATGQRLGKIHKEVASDEPEYQVLIYEAVQKAIDIAPPGTLVLVAPEFATLSSYGEEEEYLVSD